MQSLVQGTTPITLGTGGPLVGAPAISEQLGILVAVTANRGVWVWSSTTPRSLQWNLTLPGSGRIEVSPLLLESKRQLWVAVSESSSDLGTFSVHVVSLTSRTIIASLSNMTGSVRCCFFFFASALFS